ncbi:MAG: 4-(cytidine 5'-diphospho)-2-C-methyl-D-erythritol kinase [bacterium]|nr:4-(cytidine 5'-diphospho)-2-C-methyl-D-erythritol kinase [bacterium]
MKLKAYAKINLGLTVLDKRPDGYHNIETLIQHIDFFDEIELKSQKTGINFVSDSPPFGEENLCFKAAKLFLETTGIKTGISINLKKHIWQGAGLGGGSSDAASILTGMNKIFDYPLKRNKLYELASQLGSDVPFFIEQYPAIVKGRGEIIKRLPFLTKPMLIVLICPDFQISTKWAYKEIDKIRFEKKLTNKKNDVNKIRIKFFENDIEGIAKSLYNDFEKVVFKKYPELLTVREKLLKEGAIGVSLSGSGSCMYGILKNKGASLPTGKARFVKLFPKCYVNIARTKRKEKRWT